MSTSAIQFPADLDDIELMLGLKEDRRSAWIRFNHANYAAPGGDLSSPFFGQYRSLGGSGPFGGSTTYNLKLDLQLRFMF